MIASRPAAVSAARSPAGTVVGNSANGFHNRLFVASVTMCGVMVPSMPSSETTGRVIPFLSPSRISSMYPPAYFRKAARRAM
jgi:hypothetical protein